MKKLSALCLNVKFTGFLTVLVILSSIFLYSCKKTDLTLDPRGSNQIEIANKFFKVPAGTDPQINRIISEIAKRNKSKEFVSSFALKNGYPVWNKVLAVKQGNINQNSVVGNIASDTIIYIPLVLQDGTQVNGFLRARMNDSIAIDYSLAQDYKTYPKSETSNAMTSDDFTLLVMKLDNITFGYEQFIIKDSSLFNTSRGNTLGNTNITKKVMFKDSASSFASNSHASNNLAITYYCEDIVISVCPTVPAFQKQDNTSWTTGTGGCEGGYSDIIEVCWEIITFSSGGSGSQLPGDGGGTPSGGGGGTGSNNIPHNYPCPETPPSINTPLCPAPGGGIGWVPVPNEEDPPAPLSVNNVDNQLTSLCFVNIFNQITEAKLKNEITKLFQDVFFGNGKVVNLQIKEVANLTYPNGQPIVAQSQLILPGGAFNWVITLNSGFINTASKEYLGHAIIHELVHSFAQLFKYKTNGILTDIASHELMFKNWVNIMRDALIDIFSLTNLDATALALQGMDDVLMKTNSSGNLQYKTELNQFALSNYGMDLASAYAIYLEYENKTKGTQCP